MTTAPPDASPRRRDPAGGAGGLLRPPRRRHARARASSRTATSTSAGCSTSSAGPEIQRAIWFTLWSSTVGDAARLRARAARRARPPPARDPRPHLDPRRSWSCRSCCRPSWSASPSSSSSATADRWVARPRRQPGRDRRRPGVLQRLGRDPGRRRRLGVARPAPGRGRGRARRVAVRRCCATSPSPPCGRRSSRPRRVVFLFCATAFGIVLTLGGLRYSSVETQIYLLTTDLLDLQAAAALSVLQLVVVTGAAGRGGPRPSYAGRHGRARSRVAAPPATPRRPPGPRRDAGPAACWWSLPLAVAGRRVAARSTAPGAWPTTAPCRRPAPTRRCSSRSPTPLVNSAPHRRRRDLDVAAARALARDDRHPPLAHPRRAPRSGPCLDGLFMLPLGVSAVTLGFGFLVTLGQPAARPARLAAADPGRPGPGRAAARRPDPRPGARRDRRPAAPGRRDPRRLAVRAPCWWSTSRSIWKPLLAAAGFAFACSLGEFGATSFLVRDDRPTLPVVIFRLIGHPGDLNYGMALAASVVLGATTAVVMLVVERLRVPSVGTLLMTRALRARPLGLVRRRRPPSSTPTSTSSRAGCWPCSGPSGCGKSTLLRAIAGLEPATGTRRAGTAPTCRRRPTHRRGFALMFQDGQLFPQLTRRPQRRLPAPPPAYAARRRPTARVADLLDLVGLVRLRRPAADDPVRRRAAARRPGPGAGRVAAPAAPRRAAERPRRRTAPAPGRGPAPDPGRGRAPPR